MLDSGDNSSLPPIPGKRYFTIGEVSELCLVKPHVLRYWEQEFPQLKPIKRRGNRRYYQRHEVQLIRRIRQLLYGDGFTISGARNKLGTSATDSSSTESSTSTMVGNGAKPAVSSAAVGELIRELNEVVELLQD